MDSTAQVHTWVPAHDAAQAHAWVPIREAAAALGVSPDTIKRRMKTGELTARREPRPQGFVWLVQLEHTTVPAPVTALHTVVPASVSAPMDTPVPATDTNLAVALAQVEELRAMVRVLSDELAARRQEVHDLLALVQRGSPPQEQEGSTTAGTVVSTTTGAPVAHQHARMQLPWWRRVLRALTDGA